MVIHTYAAGQRQTFENPPFVFHKQRVLVGLRAAGTGEIYAVFQFVITIFAAESEQLVIFAKRHDDFAVQRVIFGGNSVGIFILDVFTVETQFGVCPAPAAVVPDGVVFALNTVFIQRIGIAILAVEAVPESHVLIVGWRQCKFDVGVARGVTFDARLTFLTAGGVCLIFFTLAQCAKNFYTEQAVDQRTTGEEVAVVAVATVAVLLHGGIRAKSTVPGRTDFFGDDVDHAAQRIRA